MRPIKLFIILAGMVCSLATIHAATETDRLAGLDEFIIETMKLSGAPGLALSVVQGDRTVIAKGYGLRAAGRPERVDENTVFAIGSNSKLFTSIAVGMLVEEGKLQWDTPLTRYLPGLRFSDPYLFTEVTLRDALSHRTGLKAADLAWYANPGISRKASLMMIEHLPLEIPLRSGYFYNNFMYHAASEVIPASSGKSWDEFLRERIFTPLSMDRSNTGVDELLGMQNVASPHVMVDGAAVPVPYYDLDHIAAAGSINSSASDMARWCAVQLADGKLGDTQIIPETVLAEVRKPQMLMPLSSQGYFQTVHGAYGLGIARANYGDEQVIYYHTGRIDGMLSVFALVPEAELCVVVLTNSEPNYGLEVTTVFWILDHILGLEGKDYLADFKMGVQEEKKMEVETRQLHDLAHDEATRLSLEPSGYAGTFHNDIYGDLVIEVQDGNLRFQFGQLFRGSLVRHRHDSFDLIHDDKVRNTSEPAVLSYALDASGEVESLLLQMFGVETVEIRFHKVKEGA